MTEHALLTCLNDNVDNLNAFATSILPGESRTYTSQDSILDQESADAALYAKQYLNSLSPKGLPPHRLEFEGWPANHAHPEQETFPWPCVMVRVLLFEGSDEKLFLPKS